DRLVTSTLRSDFEAVKAQFDRQLDAIELPPALDEPDSAAEDPATDPATDPASDDESDDEFEMDTPTASKSNTPNTTGTSGPGAAIDDDDELEPGFVQGGPPDDPM
ncbi:MAG: hypothetical protein FWD57_11975, partial [Polyangiaceae bacterium]|nr:hypothetical protein [Polyangiaceae bacterium]